jgi:Domain of unknown function (DUF5069)
MFICGHQWQSAFPEFCPHLLRPDHGAHSKQRSMKKKVTGKDLRKEAPRSPRIRVGGYAILGRTIDKCRALVAGKIGEYHFDCPLDNTLFGFKGVRGDDFKAQIEQGAGDQEMVEWLNQSGEKKTPEEIKRWAERLRPAASTTIRKSASSSAKRSKNSGSIRQRQQRSSGLKSTIESLSRSKRHRSLAAQGSAGLVRKLIGK